MTRRKIVLLSACGALLCIYILQLVFASKNTVKTVKLDSDPDTVLIERNGTSVTLAKNGSAWTVGDKKYPANESTADAIVNAIKTISVLDTTGRAGTDSADERYELGRDKAITVTASAAGKTLRTVTIGKKSSTGSQTYVLIDGGKEIRLVSGNLQDTFGKSADDLRSKIVYKEDKDALTKIVIASGSSALSVAKTGNPAVWGAADGTPAVDAEKTASWADSLYSVSCASWLDDSFVLPEKPESVTTLTAGSKTVTLNVYKTGKDDNVKYYGTCSETPYRFELSSYAAGKYIKTAADFKK
jgi:hypothetical protein